MKFIRKYRSEILIVDRLIQEAQFDILYRKIKKTLELIQDFEDSGSSKHYKANAQKMRIMLDAIKKTLEK